MVREFLRVRISASSASSGLVVKSSASPACAALSSCALAGTGRDYGLTVNSTVDDRLNPAKSIMAQAQYMRSLYTHMTEASTVEDQWRLALASYNAGRGTINRAMEVYGNDFGLPTPASRVGMVDANVLINSYLPAPGQSAANGAQTQEYVRRIYGFGPTSGGYTRYYQQRF